jgi:ATP-dependent exoDNAse (exonuclease V) beta subunit
LVILRHEGKVLGAEIIDYKTDQCDHREDLQVWLKQRVEHHRPQLQAYSEVVAKMLDVRPSQIDCSLMLLSAGVRVGVEFV